MNTEETIEVSAETTDSSIPTMFIGSKDLHQILEIMVKADNISPEEAVKRINKMVDKGTLNIVPFFGKPR